MQSLFTTFPQKILLPLFFAKLFHHIVACFLSWFVETQVLLFTVSYVEYHLSVSLVYYYKFKYTWIFENWVSKNINSFYSLRADDN